VRAQQRVEDFRHCHCRESTERLRLGSMTSVPQMVWQWRFERGGSLRRI
jgi:hypothetical protein